MIRVGGMSFLCDLSVKLRNVAMGRIKHVRLSESVVLGVVVSSFCYQRQEVFVIIILYDNFSYWSLWLLIRTIYLPLRVYINFVATIISFIILIGFGIYD
jgi:hypothetical protein